ncbi:MAG: MFS transporter [Pseudomonadota bacterium]|nr:MFS transporter [Pseudomonadota bacterium]
MTTRNILALAADSQFGRLHGVVLFWCFLILVLDGYDLAVAGAALPAIMEDMGVTAATAGFMASSALFGMMFGAMGLGAVADKIGRRWTLSLCVFFFSVFTAAAGMTDDPYTFSLMRFLAGVGIGGAIPNAAAQMTEYAPMRMRAFMVTLMCCGYAVGSMLAAILGKQFIAAYGWEIVFLAAGAPVVLIPFIMLYLPESPTFLLKKQDQATLRSIARRLRPDMTIDDSTQFELPATPVSSTAGMAALFRDGRGLGTVMLWVAYITGLFMLYALSSWLVKLMSLAGYSLGSALNFLLAYNIGAIVGAIGGGWLADRFSMKWVSVSMCAAAMVSLVALGYGVQPLFLVVAVVGASTLGMQILLYAYAAQYYPPELRSVGMGFASGMGRIGAIAAPIIIGVLVSLELPLRQNFMVIALAAVITGVAVALVNQKPAAQPAVVLD